MFERLEVTRMAHALAAHASARQAVIASNVAHADTPGYRARDVEDFNAMYRRMSADRAWGAEAAGPRVLTPPSGALLSPNGNSVALETEMRNAAATRHHFDMALAIYKSVSGVIRTSLGR
jgi:flagellar basal-body rod protein FlgB